MRTCPVYVVTPKNHSDVLIWGFSPLPDYKQLLRLCLHHELGREIWESSSFVKAFSHHAHRECQFPKYSSNQFAANSISRISKADVLSLHCPSESSRDLFK